MARKPSNYPFQTASAQRVELDPNLIEGFVEIFLMDGFEDPVPTPEFHRRLWRLFCLPDKRVAVAAPRGHAKSAAGTFSYGLASALFGEQDFILIVGATESTAAKHLADMAILLETNEAIKGTFNTSILVNNETELVVRVGGREFCIMARGAEQKVRGIKWRQKRPGLVLIDDLEEDEAVENPDRRRKLREWFNNALLPAGSPKTKFRMVGTILHLDSLLERNLNSASWTGSRFRAHRDFDDFGDILWPERFSEEILRDIRQIYIDNGDASGYSKEYLSHPIASVDAYFRPSDFQVMGEKDYYKPKTFYGAIDFAISKAEKADNTAFTIGGMDPDRLLHVVHTEAARLDSLEIIDTWFRLDKEYQPEAWVVETGAIEKALGPFLREEMVKRGQYMNLILATPTKDKQTRARPLQARMRAGGCRFNEEDPGYEPLKQEMLSFPRGIHDDRVDSLSWLGLHLDKLYEADTEEEALEGEYRLLEDEALLTDGRSNCTGY